MIPTFPKFKKIEITDQKEIEDFTKDYPPYSDFNFISLFCWDVDGKRRISMLNGNLVVRSTCDVSGKEFLSFLGTNEVPKTIKELFKYAKKEGLKQELKMIPQETTNLCSDPSLSVKIEEDRDSFDYVYKVGELCEMSGRSYGSVRKNAKKFEAQYGEICRIETMSLDTKEHKEYITKIWEKWGTIKELYSQREEQALVRLLNSAPTFNLRGIIIFVDDEPVAFSISQIIDKENAIGHFAKVNYNFSGAFSFLISNTAKALQRNDCVFLNMEEDLGLPGLRRAKELYRPSFLIKKFTVSSKISPLQKIFHMLQLSR
jgi:hypothetical protein